MRNPGGRAFVYSCPLAMIHPSEVIALFHVKRTATRTADSGPDRQPERRAQTEDLAHAPIRKPANHPQPAPRPRPTIVREDPPPSHTGRTHHRGGSPRWTPQCGTPPAGSIGAADHTREGVADQSSPPRRKRHTRLTTNHLAVSVTVPSRRRRVTSTPIEDTQRNRLPVQCRAAVRHASRWNHVSGMS